MTSSAQPPAGLVLIVDDDRLFRMQLNLFLTKEGYRVAEANDGEEALSEFMHLQPDLVLLDAQMPILDGFSCCTQIRRLADGDRVPILILTGLEDAASVNLAFEVGASDYITKPIQWAVLRQRVRRLIQQAQLYHQLETANQQLEAANQLLYRQVSIDGLTQVANRRHFDLVLAKEWRRLAREQAPLSLILCDVDCFKLYNDTYGHQAGDRCLQQIAQVMQETTHRSADLVARYGGEEFAVVLPHTNLAGAIRLATLLRAQIHQLNLPHCRSAVRDIVTVSLGVACTVPQSSIPIETLITLADKALYQAKANGRDQVFPTA